MKNPSLFFLLLNFLLLPYSGFSQWFFIDKQSFHVGVQSGFGSCQLDSIGKTIIRDEYYNPANYHTEQRRRIFGHTGLYVGFFPKGSPVAFDLGVQLSYPTHFSGGKKILSENYKSDFYYSDVKGLTYDIHFNYYYINIPLTVSMPIKLPGRDENGPYIAPRAGIKPYFTIGDGRKNNIFYESNDTTQGIDLTVRDNLRNVLRPRSYFGFTLGGEIGWYFFKKNNDEEKWRVYLNFMWDTPATDALETLSNGYNFIDNKNPRRSWQLGLGIQLNLLGLKNNNRN